jgi:lysyl-tRNA synthetase class 2
MSEWQPSAEQAARIARDQLYQQIRAFFQARHYIEVDPPLMGISASTDVHLHSFAVDIADRRHYLQTSPEFFMKRLLAAGSGPIYALTKSFRGHEQGRFHNLEFTLLEWYQPGFDDHALMEQVSEFIQVVLGEESQKLSYRDCFLQRTGLNPHVATIAELKSYAKQQIASELSSENRDTWLELIFSHCIQPSLRQATLIYDYPSSQAALAKITGNEHGESVARRFEVFCQGVELGNGYWELTDGEEQMRRFTADNQRRQRSGLETMPIDTKLVQALKAGMPECAGIAMGVDRLLMLQTGADHIEVVLDFPQRLL